MYRIASLKIKVLVTISFGIFLSCSADKESLPYYNTADFTPIFISNKSIVNDSITHQIADFTFTNQDGKLISNKNISGKIHVANFIFTSCNSICPVMTSNFQKVSDSFKNDSNIVMLSYSVTPWIDSVAKLKSYQKKNNISNPNWHFLTGNKAKIYKLARTSYFAEEDLGFTKDSTQFLHTEHILLVDKSKRIRGIYNGTLKLDIDQLITDIKILSKE